MAHSKSEIRKAKNLLNKYAPKGEQLAYINSKEAKLLKSKGGAGKDVNVSGIKSYFDPGKGSGSVSESLSEAAGLGSSTSNNGGGGGGSNDSDDDAKALSYAVKSTPQKSMLSRVGGFIRDAAGAALTASTFGVGPAVGSLLYKGGKKAVSYVKKNISGKITRVVAGPGDSYPLTNKDFGKKNINFVNAGGGGDNTPPAQNVGGRIVKLSPTTAEISQSSATDASPYDNRKTKAKGRSMTIMTSSRGINRNNTLTLGKPSLLGA
jgi:hypothetical protein